MLSLQDAIKELCQSWPNTDIESVSSILIRLPNMDRFTDDVFLPFFIVPALSGLGLPLESPQSSSCGKVVKLAEALTSSRFILV